MSKKPVIVLFLSMFIVFNLTTSAAWAASAKTASPKFTVATISLKTGEKVDLKTKLKSKAKVAYRYASSNAKVVSVTGAGIVTGISTGNATVTATVSQKGYSGKASIAVQVVAPASTVGTTPKGSTSPEGTTIPDVAKPVVYKDLELLDTDIRNALQTLYKKDYAKLTIEEMEQLDKLMNIDRQQLLLGLQAIVQKATPAWSSAMVAEFASHNLENNIKDIAALFSMAGSDNNSKQAVVSILKAFKSDKALATFGTLMMYSKDADLRYSLAYLISEFGSSQEALTILVNAVLKETDDKSLLNEVAALIKVAGTDPDNVRLVLIVYGQLSDSNKGSFASLFLYNDPAKGELFKAWKSVLKESQQSEVPALKDAANSLWDKLKNYKQFKD